MVISLELIFQLLNTFLLLCIPIIFIFILIAIFRYIKNKKNNNGIIYSYTVVTVMMDILQQIIKYQN